MVSTTRTQYNDSTAILSSAWWARRPWQWHRAPKPSHEIFLQESSSPVPPNSYFGAISISFRKFAKISRNSGSQRCQNTIWKIHLVKHFPNLPSVVHLEVISLKISTFFKWRWLGVRGKMIHEETLSKKSRGTVPISTTCHRNLAVCELRKNHSVQFNCTRSSYEFWDAVITWEGKGMRG